MERNGGDGQTRGGGAGKGVRRACRAVPNTAATRTGPRSGGAVALHNLTHAHARANNKREEKQLATAPQLRAARWCARARAVAARF